MASLLGTRTQILRYLFKPFSACNFISLNHFLFRDLKICMYMVMNILQFVDDLVYPQNLWLQHCTQHANNLLFENPPVDLAPVDGGLELRADLPGIARQDVKVTVKENYLTLSGERVDRHVSDDRNKWHYSERRFGKFMRRIRLPFLADPSGVTAKFENGVLTVFIPQPEATETGEITIV